MTEAERQKMLRDCDKLINLQPAMKRAMKPRPLPITFPKSFLLDLCGWTEDDVTDAVENGWMHPCEDMYVPDPEWVKGLQDDD